MAIASPTPDAVELPIVAETLDKLDKAMAALEPQVIQYNAYAEVKARLLGSPRAAARTAPASTTTRSAPRARHGGRLEQFLTLVTQSPGQTLPDYAKQMDVAPNYLYRIRDKARGDGKIRVEGTNIFPITELEARTAELEAAAAKNK